MHAPMLETIGNLASAHERAFSQRVMNRVQVRFVALLGAAALAAPALGQTGDHVAC